MEQVEGVLAAVGVAGVERLHALDRGRHDGVVALAGLGGRVGEVAQHREVQVRLPVGQELDLEVLQRLAHRVDAGEERGDDDGGAVLGRHAVLVQVELGQGARREERGDQLVHHVDRDVAGQEQTQEHHGDPGRRGPRSRPATAPPPGPRAWSASTPPTKTTLGGAAPSGRPTRRSRAGSRWPPPARRGRRRSGSSRRGLARASFPPVRPSAVPAPAPRRAPARSRAGPPTPRTGGCGGRSAPPRGGTGRGWRTSSGDRSRTGPPAAPPRSGSGPRRRCATPSGRWRGGW